MFLQSTTRHVPIQVPQGNACVIYPLALQPNLFLFRCFLFISCCICLQTADNVFGPGSPRYDDAYFEINYIRGYTLSGVSISSTTAINYSSPSAQVLSSVAATSTGTSSSSTPSQPSAEWPVRAPGIILCTALLALVGFWMA